MKTTVEREEEKNQFKLKKLNLNKMLYEMKEKILETKRIKEVWRGGRRREMREKNSAQKPL